MERPTFRDAVENCRYCFMCRHAGTAFRATKRDALTARGRALQLSAVLDGFREWTAETADIVYLDPIDGLCRELCVYHWPEDDLLRESRRMLVEQGLEPMAVKAAMEAIAVQRDSDWRPDAACTGPNSGTLYLSGWAARRYAPALIDAQLRVLDAGYGDVSMLADETATAAAAAFDLGYVNQAAALSARLIDAIKARKPARVVTGCSHTLRVLHGETGGPDFSKSVPVLHLTEAIDQFVADGRIKLKPLPANGRAALHDAEHLARTRHLVDEPRKIVDICLSDARVEFEHHGAIAESAGAGAALFVTHPGQTATIAATRIGQARDVGIDHIVTACPHCYIAFGTWAGEGPIVEDISQLVCRAAGL